MRTLKWALIGCAALLVAGYAWTKPLQDFVEYWVAAHQFVAGRNPYSFAESFQLERALGWGKTFPALPPNPPWSLPLIAPLGIVKSYPAGWVLWVAALTFMVWWSMKILLKLYSNGRRLFPSETASSERILAFTFYPTLLCLGTAQITPFVLLGVTGFLSLVDRKRYAFAGACLALASVKPQLVYLLWPGLLFWCWRRKAWTALLGLGAGVAGLLGGALLLRPDILSDYWHFSQSGYVRIWPSALGAILRYPFHSTSSFPLQFVAPAIGTIWFLLYWRRHADDWDWKERTPLVIAASVLTAPYGWTLDEVLLLVPIVAIVAHYVSTTGRIPRQSVWVYTALNVALILGSLAGPAAAYLIAPLAMTIVLLVTERASDDWTAATDPASAGG